jgi:hypothetical protein|tara:strand:+ start:6709 stop:7320 length:612 start_codon:yes stop_codon:yes gene_type:complete
MDINMKSLLIETLPFNVSPITLTEGKSTSGNPLVEGILATVEVKNGNGRYYSKELWERELEKYNVLVKERRACGELDHPDSQVINLKNVSHNISKLWWDGDNVMGSIELLPTPSGNILKALIGAGIKVGVSSRGMGSLKQVGEVLEVQDDFDLLCWDFVSTPSNPGSYMSPLNEGLSTSINPYSKVNSIITDILCANGTCPIF